MSVTLPEPLAKASGSQEIYSCLLQELEKFGAFEIEEKKTCLHARAGRAAFLGIHPRREGLRLNIVLSRPLAGSRIVKSDQVSKSRFHNEIDVEVPSDIDGEVVAWLKEAYKLQCS